MLQTITSTGFLRAHNQLGVFGELIGILLMSIGVVRDLIEGLEELGDLGLDEAVAWHGGFVLAHLYVLRVASPMQLAAKCCRGLIK